MSIVKVVRLLRTAVVSIAELGATRRLSKDLRDRLRHASNRADAPQTCRCEERRTGHSQRCSQSDLQDKHRVFL
jgi:hypothetical protein